MAKVTDYEKVYAKVVDVLDEKEWFILDYCDADRAAQIIVNIYFSNDMFKSYGQDLYGGFSVISSEKSISIIYQKSASSFKSDFPLCNYQDLEDDIDHILTIMDAAFLRMQFSM